MWYPEGEADEWETIVTLRGYPYRVRRRRMPRVTERRLGCVFYLYPNEDDARNGERAGGTGFFIAVKSEVYESRPHLYAVTCKHVVIKDNSPVMRFNKVNGQFDVLPLRQEDWISYEDVFPGENRDLAIHEITEIDPTSQIEPIESDILLTQNTVKYKFVGLGDEVFMVGRYIDNEGIQKNVPSLRFGNISMMPGEPLENDFGYKEVGFVIEMRSISGYSGSPVFLYIPPKGKAPYPIFLLGVQWSRAPYEEIHKDEKHLVHVYSGMSNAVPAWYISCFLDWERFQMHRKQKDEEYAREKRRSPVSTGAAREPEPFTKEDFEAALKKVSRPLSDKRRHRKSVGKKKKD